MMDLGAFKTEFASAMQRCMAEPWVEKLPPGRRKHYNRVVPAVTGWLALLAQGAAPSELPRWCAIISDQLGHPIGERTLQTWTRRFLAFGPRGLVDGRGRPAGKRGRVPLPPRWLRAELPRALDGSETLEAAYVRLRAAALERGDRDFSRRRFSAWWRAVQRARIARDRLRGEEPGASEEGVGGDGI